MLYVKFKHNDRTGKQPQAGVSVGRGTNLYCFLVAYLLLYRFALSVRFALTRVLQCDMNSGVFSAMMMIAKPALIEIKLKSSYILRITHC